MVVDDDELLQAMGNDRETVQAVVRTFLRALDAYQTELQACLAANSVVSVRETAHKLKGALSSLRAPEACADATALESAALDGRSDELPGLALVLLNSMSEVREHFASPKYRAPCPPYCATT